MSTTSLIATQTPGRKPIPTAPTAVVPKPSPGTWRHPKLTEIATRQSQTTFSDRKLQQALYNTLAFLASFGLRSWLDTTLRKLDTLLSLPSSSTPAVLLIWTLRVYLLVNITQAIRPLFPYLYKQDDITDIPLTPSQRALLGLDPSATPPTPLSADDYITPPKYRRSSTSFSSSSPSSQLQTDRRSISANYSSSPLSTSRYTLGFSPSPQPQASPFRSTDRRTASGSPFSPTSASPLLQKAIAKGSREARDFADRRQSFGASTSTLGPGLGRTQSLRERNSRVERDVADPGSPSPLAAEFRNGGVKRNAGVNYKWMYERGVGPGLPRSETMQF